MPTPFRNRLVHLDSEVDAQEWSEWAIGAAKRPEVIAFIRFRPGCVRLAALGEVRHLSLRELAI